MAIPHHPRHVLSLVRTWFRRARRRRQLRNELGEASPQWLARMERDVGLPPGGLAREMHKPFWTR